jgi:hypothetical protein
MRNAGTSGRRRPRAPLPPPPPPPLLLLLLLLLPHRCVLLPGGPYLAAAGSIPPVENIPQEQVVEPPVMKTELELSPHHDVAELPLLPPDLFPISDPAEVGDPWEPFRPSGPDDQLKAVNGGSVPADPRPCGRWQHTAVVVKDEIMIYGGVSNGGVGVLSDLWFYDAPGGSWTKLEKSEMCALPSSANPRHSTSQNNGRPPFFPAPPRYNQPPGVDAERIQQLRVEQETKVEKDTKPLRIDRMTPVPVEEPIVPQVGDGGGGSGVPADNTRRRRRRRLQAYSRLGVLPAPEHNELQAQPMTLGEIWAYSVATRRWYQPYPTGKQPPPRWLHAAVSLAGRMVVFGGVTNNLMLLNDLWEYSPIPNSWREIIPGKTMDRPVPREGHSMVALSPKGGQGDASALVFGGISYGYTPFNDLWQFSVTTGNWEAIEPIDGAGAALAMLSGKDEEKKEPPKPPGRWMHSAVVIDGVLGKAMFVFGGCSESFAPLNDLWRFDVKTKVWLELGAPNPKLHDTVSKPAGRWLHSSVSFKLANGGDGIVVFGGGINSSPLDDLWYWDTKGRAWEEMHPFTDHPYARMGQTLVSMNRDEATGTVAKRRRRRRRLLKMDEGDADKEEEEEEEEEEGKVPYGSFRFRGKASLQRGFVGDAAASTLASSGAGKGKIEKSDIEVDGSSDIFAMDGPQEVRMVDPSTTPDLVQRPTSDSDDFMFLWGGMAEKGLGSSASGFGLGIENRRRR